MSKKQEMILMLVSLIALLIMAWARGPPRTELAEDIAESISLLEESQLKTPPVVIQEYPRITSEDLEALQSQGEATLDEGSKIKEAEPLVEEPLEEDEGAAELPEYEPIEEAEEVIEEDVVMADEAEQETGMIYMGEYQITAYEWTGYPCANGNYPEEGYTAACNSLPFGTVVYIEGIGYRTVEDRGADWHSDQWIDVYMGDVWTCNQFGVQYLEVWVVE